MKCKRHTEEQIIAILQEHEAGVKAADLCRKHGISEASFYNWKAKYGGLEVSEAKRLKGLESENVRLKKLFADAMLDNAALKALLAKNVWSAPSMQGTWTDNDDSCVNVSGLSRVDCCCSQAMMRDPRVSFSNNGTCTGHGFLPELTTRRSTVSSSSSSLAILGQLFLSEREIAPLVDGTRPIQHHPGDASNFSHQGHSDFIDVHPRV
jgi:putative transposase